MKLTNKLNYPPAYVKAAERYIYPRTEGRIGVTELIESPQIRRLYIERYDDLIIDVSDFFTPMLGSAWHYNLQRNCPEEFKAEKKYEVDLVTSQSDGKKIGNVLQKRIGDITLVGKADLVNGGIEDYKLMSAWSWVFDKDKHFIDQLNILNWLRINSGIQSANYLRTHCFIKDWSPYKAKQNSDYPQQKFFRRDLPVWPLEQTEKFIVERLKLHADKNYQCTDEDKWSRAEGFAVMKKGRKSALRVLNTQAEAMKWCIDNNWAKSGQLLKEISIVERKSECKRCLSYCSVRSVCPFAKSLKQ